MAESRFEKLSVSESITAYNYQYQKYRQGNLDIAYVDGDTGPKTWPLLRGDYKM